MVKKGEWVRIHKVILEPSERAPQVPDDTKECPLEMWTKGFLTADAEIGDFDRHVAPVPVLTDGEERGCVFRDRARFSCMKNQKCRDSNGDVKEKLFEFHSVSPFPCEGNMLPESDFSRIVPVGKRGVKRLEFERFE